MGILSRKRLLIWLLGTGLALPLIVFLSYLISQYISREAAKAACKQRLKQLGKALQDYHDEHASFPPAYLVDKEGKPAHSWRVLLLPYLGRQDLYDAYRFDEPWDGPNNRKLEDQLRDVYSCPGEPNAPPWRTNYVAVVSAVTAWPGSQPVGIKYFVRGTSYTILLVEIANSEIHWMEPRDLRMADLVGSDSEDLGEDIPGPHPGIVHCLFCDGSVTALPRTMDRRTFFTLLTLNNGVPFNGQWLPGEKPLAALPARFPAETDASRLQATDVHAHLDADILPGRNYIYAASLQLAWDEFRQKAGAAPQVEGNQELAAALNKHPFPRSALTPSAYVARMGPASERISEEIRAEMKTKFPSVTPSLLEPENPGVILSYAFIQKNLTFNPTFERLDEPLVFRGSAGKKKVASFGRKEFGDSVDEYKNLVRILDYVSDEDFILSLRDASDEIILAKVRPEATAAATLEAVRRRIRERSDKVVHPDLQKKETLIVPRMALNIVKRYGELDGKHLLNTPWKGLWFAEPRQGIRFLLNEKGALFDSSASMEFPDGHEVPPKPRELIFNRPFLLAMKERQAEEPYLVIWVENTELMEPRSR
jgi:hypothetical protein